jgi:membrane protease YdiL (CAAX protease family)
METAPPAFLDLLSPAVQGLVLTVVAYEIAGGRRPTEGRRAIGFVAFALVFIAAARAIPGAVPVAVPEVSAYPSSRLAVQLLTNAVLAAPCVGWMLWRRRGAAALGLARADLSRSLAIGALVSIACVGLSDRLSLTFWTAPDTLRLLLAQVGVGLSEEIVFRGILLGSLMRRMSTSRAEVLSATIFSVVHIPQRLAHGTGAEDLMVDLALLFVWGWCFAIAMRRARNVPGLALVHAVINVANG